MVCKKRCIEAGIPRQTEISIVKIKLFQAELAGLPVTLGKGNRLSEDRIVAKRLQLIRDSLSTDGMYNRMPLNKQAAIMLGEVSLRVHPSIHDKVVLRSGRHGIFNINITGKMAMPDVGNRRRDIWLVEIQVDGGLTPAVGQNRPIVGAVQLMEGEAVTVDIELTAAIAPFDIVGINLFVIA